MKWGVFESVASVLIALSALIFSVYSFKKKRDRADVHAKTGVRPLLSIKSQNRRKLKSIRLVNDGVGHAIITKASFRRTPESESTNNIVDLFNLNIDWETFVNVPENRAIPANSEMMLIRQSLEHLIDQGISEDDGLSILRDWKSQKTGILVHIEYSDIYDNEMEAIDETLN